MRIWIDWTCPVSKEPTGSKEISQITISMDAPGIAHANTTELVQSVQTFAELLRAGTSIDAINNWVKDRYNKVATVTVPPMARVGIPA